MGSVYIHVDLPCHPKIIRAGQEATSLYINGLCYCSRHKTKRIPIDALASLSDPSDADEVARRLMAVELWSLTDDGYIISDYLKCRVAPDLTIQEQRKTREYESWRRAVLKRDGYKCVKCGSMYCKLHAHHISSWAEDILHRFDIDNGLTLCVVCHKLEH